MLKSHLAEPKKKKKKNHRHNASNQDKGQKRAEVTPLTFKGQKRAEVRLE